MEVNNELIVRKQLKIFFVIAFVFNFLMGFGIYYGKKQAIDVNVFPILQMMTPALGAIVAIMVTMKADERIPKYSFLTYIISSIILALMAIGSLFIKSINFVQICQFSILLMSIGMLLAMIIDKKEQRLSFNLNMVSFRKVVLMIILFIFIYFLRVIIVSYLAGEEELISNIFSAEKVVYAIALIPSIFISFIPFFGEEYGWRYFLQPILQNKFGMVKGLIVLGLIWGVWHLPLNLFYYSAEGSGILSLVNQIIVCVSYSIMFGFAYSFSKSIWAPVAIHFFNNNLILMFTDTMDTSVIENQEYTWESVIFAGISMLISYGIFIFSKYNRKEEFRLPDLNERLEILEVKEYENEKEE